MQTLIIQLLQAYSIHKWYMTPNQKKKKKKIRTTKS